MTYFNDELLEGHLYDFKTGLNLRSKVYIEKELMRKKNQKASASNVGFEKKVKIVRTETDYSNLSSVSVKNS